ncbi:MAG: TolC family protein [Deltaproteobacteria bacterium]|nr:TolC family protein [Deltaproteobacteria bacterium]
MKNLLTLLILLLPLPLHAQTLTLDEVVKTVRETHPAIESAKQDAESAKQMKKAESWLEDPMVGVMFEEVPLNSPSPGNADMTDYMVSQKLPFPSVLVTKNRALDAEYKAKLQMAIGRERERVFDAKKTYFELVAARNELKAQKAILGNYRQMVVSLETEYKTRGDKPAPSKEMSPGMETGALDMSTGSLFSDLMMAKMKKAEAEAAVYDLEHKEKTASARLNLMMGREAMTPIAKLEEPKVKKLSWDEKTLEQKLLAQNSDLKAMEWMVKKMEKEVSLAWQDLIPMVEPEFQYNRRQNMDNAYTLGINLNIPLWLNKKSHNISRAKAEQRKAKSELEAGVLDMKSSLHFLIHYAMEHRKIVLKYRGEVLPLARSAWNSAETAYQAGVISSSNLLQKLIGYHEASKMYWDIWMDYQMEYAMLEAMVGEEL